MRLDLHEDPAVIQMADKMNVREEVVVGYLHRVWSWVSRQCHGESVTNVTVMSRSCHAPVSLASLGRVLKLDGFPEQMASVGWLEEVEGEGIRVPHFDRWLSQTAKDRALATLRKRKQRAENGHADVTVMSRSKRDKSVTTTTKQNKQSSSLVNVGDVCLEEARRQAKSICRALYGDTAELMDSTRQTIWVFAWLAAAGILSEAEVADVIASACKPRVQNRAQYLRGCLDKKLTKRKSSWDDAFAAAPARPKPVPDEPK
jgi:hypothetical protein